MACFPPPVRASLLAKGGPVRVDWAGHAVNIPRRKFLQLAGGVATLGGAIGAAHAQSYPSRPVRIIVATSAGGSTDIAARLIAQWLTERLGQSFVVENRPGGNNNIGTEMAAHSAADGYTLFMANSVNAINMALYNNLDYDFIADFAPVVHVMSSPILMMVHPSVPAKTVPEFIALAKANPDKLAMGSGGNGSSGHLAGELFMMMAGVKMVHVPYRGESLALSDLLGGQAQVVFATTGSSIPLVNAGSVRALAVTSSAPLADLPQVPPMAQFLPGYEVSGWSGLCAPKGTPQDIVGLLNKEINAALVSPTISQRVADMGGAVPGGSPADFTNFIAGDIDKWRKVAAFAGIKVN
jgi:tripartite-type tricarboxylate transporter receptor subunit TctC